MATGRLAKPGGSRLTDPLRPIADGLGIGTGALAVSWSLSVDGVTGAICGARRPEQVDGWIGAADVILDPPMLAELDAMAQGLEGAERDLPESSP
jgi:aryl-alcohol dehydrogenase-like predicted oxidoreductase